MKIKIGFIGLAIMGKPMCKNLLEAGYNLVVLKRNKAAVDEVVAAGATAVDTPKAVAEQAHFIITMLPNSPNVKAVIWGENGVIEGAEPGTVVIDMSSIAPLVSKAICTELETIGVEMLDAPVSGGEPKAIDGTISVMVGGKKEVLDAKATQVMDRKFDPGFRIELHIKDLANVLETAHEVGVPLPLTAGVMEIMQALKVDGKQGLDNGGLIRHYEKLARVEVSRKWFLGSKSLIYKWIEFCLLM